MVSLTEQLERINARGQSPKGQVKQLSIGTEPTDDCSVISFSSSFSSNSRSNCYRPEDSISSSDLLDHELAVLEISLVDACADANNTTQDVREGPQPSPSPSDPISIEIMEENDPLANFLLHDPDEEEDEEEEDPQASPVTEFLQDRWFTFTRNLDTIQHNWSILFQR